MTAIADALAAQGLAVRRFEFAYMAARRTGAKSKPPPRAEAVMDEYRAALAAVQDEAPGRIVVGGKSMGGRVATLLADEAGAAGCVVFGYPFHPPGKPDTLRTAHLEGLRTPTLICQGTRDPFGTQDEVPGYALSDAIELLWLDDGDHDLKPRKRETGLTQADHIRTAATHATRWIAAL